MKYTILPAFILGVFLSLLPAHAAEDDAAEQRFQTSAYTTRLPASFDSQLQDAVSKKPTKVLKAQALCDVAATVWDFQPTSKSAFTVCPRGELSEDLSWVDTFLSNLGVPSLTETGPLFFTREKFVSRNLALASFKSGGKLFMATGFEEKASYVEISFTAPTVSELSACTTALSRRGAKTISEVVTRDAPFFSRLNDGAAVGYEALVQSLEEYHKKSLFFLQAPDGSTRALRLQRFTQPVSVFFTDQGINGPYVTFAPTEDAATPEHPLFHTLFRGSRRAQRAENREGDAKTRSLFLFRRASSRGPRTEPKAAAASATAQGAAGPVSHPE